MVDGVGFWYADGNLDRARSGLLFVDRVLFFDRLKPDMSADQISGALAIMKRNLEKYTDWIVLNQTMTTLAKWAKEDEVLKRWLRAHLERLSSDQRASVAKTASKSMKTLYS